MRSWLSCFRIKLTEEKDHRNGGMFESFINTPGNMVKNNNSVKRQLNVSTGKQNNDVDLYKRDRKGVIVHRTKILVSYKRYF